MKLPNDSVARVTGALAKADLGHGARVKRARKVLAKVAKRPSASLPAALGVEAEIQAAYRFFNSRHVSFSSLLKPHFEETAKRARRSGDVLVLHDTTDASFPHLDPREIGYLPTGKAGFLLHLSLVLDGREWRRPLGLVHAETLHRPQRSKRRGKRRASGTETAKQGEREFERWWRGIQASAQALDDCRRVIHIADRESDSFELMTYTMSLQQGFIFRVRVDRRAQEADDGVGWSTVKEVASRCEGVLERVVPLSRRKRKGAPGMNRAHAPRKMRNAKLTFAATSILIPRPQYLHEPFPEALELNVVHVIEKDPPPGESPVEWLLYTNEPINTPRQIARIVDHYRSRWTIEEYNSAIKTGCAYEAREFETRHALLNVLALTLPIATEVLWLRSRARAKPSAPGTDVLTPLQIRVLRRFSSREVPPRPTVQQVLLAVASLGGHVKANGNPGWKILLRGRELLEAYEAGWSARRENVTRRRGGI